MGQSTEELTTQIAGTRESLATDLDALQNRVSPSAIVERRKEAARGRGRVLEGHRRPGEVQAAVAQVAEPGQERLAQPVEVQ